MRPPPISLLSNRELNALTLRQRDPWLLPSDDEHVTLTGSELVLNSVFQVYDVKATVMPLAVSDDAYTSHVAATSDHGNHTSVKMNEVRDFAGSKINLDGIVNFDGRVGISDGSSIMSNKEWNALPPKLDSLDLAQLILRLFSLDAMHSKPTLGIIDQPKVLASLVDRDDIHKSSGVGGVGADLAIDFYVTLHENSLRFSGVESIL